MDVLITGDEPVTLGLRIDIAPETTAQNFRIGITDGGPDSALLAGYAHTF